MKHSEFLNVAKEAALKAGAFLHRRFGTQMQCSFKPGRYNIVTECDKTAEGMIIDTLLKAFPSHAILAEESGASKQKSEVVWIIDPLDGTINFSRSVPIFSVSIAASVGGRTVCGVVYQPMTAELFFAEKGKGSFLNKTPLAVTSTPSMDKAFLASGFPYNVHENPLHCIETFGKMLRLGIPMRRLGSAAIDLSYVAAGRFDAYFEVTLQPWDFAAGQLIVEEAGGKVTNYEGRPHDLFSQGPILASNGYLHQQMVEKLCT